MSTIAFILVLVAFVCFVIAAVPRNWVAIGLAAYMLSILVGGFSGVVHAVG